MKKLLSLLISSSLLFTSVVPSYGQITQTGRHIARTATQTSKLPILLRGPAIGNATAGAIGAAAGQLAQTQRALAASVERQVWVSRSALKDFSTNGSLLGVSNQILSLPATDVNRAGLLRNEWVLLGLSDQVLPSEKVQALAFYKKDLANKLDAFEAIKGKTLQEVLSQQEGASIVCREALSDASALGLLGQGEDAELLIKLHTAAVGGPLEQVATRITGRGLLRMGAYEPFNAWVSGVKQEGEFWLGLASYARREHLPVAIAPTATVTEAVPEELTAWLEKGSLVNGLNGVDSFAATEKWMSVGKPLAAAPEEGPVLATSSAREFARQLSAGLITPSAAFDVAPLAAAEELAESVPEVEPALQQAAQAVSFSLTPASRLNVKALQQTLQSAGVDNAKKIAKKVTSTFNRVRQLVDSEFSRIAKENRAQGALLGTEDYNELFSLRFGEEIAADKELAPLATQISQSMQQIAEQSAAKPVRTVEYSLKIDDEKGKTVPTTFTLKINLLDKTAVRQFERLNIADSEVFKLMRTSSGAYELMLATPGGSKRGVYEPFVEGGKNGIEALYYRLVGDHAAGLLESPEARTVTLNFFSDGYAEKATKWAGLTEGVGGLPQSTVAPLSTAVGITDPKALQQGVSHSQMGNVASIIFSGLQKEFGIKTTLGIGLGVAALGLAMCGGALNIPSLAGKISALGFGSLILGIGANGGVKSTNSIFAKEMSNDSDTGTARMGFVNARASIGTMAGYLFFPISAALAITGIPAFQYLYYLAAAAPAYALYNLVRSQVQSTPGTARLSGKGIWNVVKTGFQSGKRIVSNIINNFVFALTGGYKERLAALRDKQISKKHGKEYNQLINGNTTPVAVQANQGMLGKVKDFFTLQLPAATSQYILRMMAVVGLYHFAGMMYNSGPGAIIGNFVKSAEGAGLVDYFHNGMLPSALLAGVIGFAGTKMIGSISKAIKASRNAGKAALEETLDVEKSAPGTTLEKVTNFIKENKALDVGALAAGLTAVSPQLGELMGQLTSRLDPTAVAQIATFFTAYVGVWAGRQYLAKFVKSGRLSAQGIIGASGALSTLSTGLAFIPGLPLAARAALWGVAGLGFANLAGFENSLAMEKYPKQKPAVNMAYTLARLSGALTVLYGTLTTVFKNNGIVNPDVYALVLPFGALLTATLINRKYLTNNFVQDVKRWMKIPSKLSYSAVRSEADGYYAKYIQSRAEAEETRAQDVARIARVLYDKTSHELTTIEQVMGPLNTKLRLNDLRLRLLTELKGLLNGAEHNSVRLDSPELTYKKFRTYEVEPLMQSLMRNGVSAQQEEELIKSAAAVINGRYFITEQMLNDIEKGVSTRMEGLDKFRLDVLREMYRMQLTEVAQAKAERYRGARPSYDRTMAELTNMAQKVLGPDHGWIPPAYQP